MLFSVTTVTVLLGRLFFSCAAADTTTDSSASSPMMIVTAHPQATDAGMQILQAGGTAVDAMIAVQTVLGLVEPQSSGLGGGAFAVYYEASTQQLTTWDGRETAPRGATAERFVNDDETQQPLNFFQAWQSALSVGVPGVPRLLEEMHGRYGNQPWPSLFQQAQTLATDGFELTGRTEAGSNLLLFLNPSCQQRLFFRDPVAFEYFVNSNDNNTDCTAKPQGTVVTNPEYAVTLQALASGGADVFYTGDIAADIVDKLAADRNPTNDSTVSLEDLRTYQVVQREPVCQLYRGRYQVCGMGPPSSGGLAVGQIFGILDQFNVTTSDDENTPQDVDTVHMFTQAMRLAFADREQYVADTDFVKVPVAGMLDETYLAQRANLINPQFDMGMAEPGIPPGADTSTAPQEVSHEGGTSHMSIIDQYGNALSMTTTVESFFGNGLMVRGFLLNNQLTDFSFAPANDNGMPIANRVQPGKRPRSSMTPTIVLDANSGQVLYLAGSPGGPRIIGYVAKALMAMMDFGYGPADAVRMPHTQNQNADTELEVPGVAMTTTNYDYEALAEALRLRNHTVVLRRGDASGLALIQATPEGGYEGGADPRRDGTVAGDNGASATPDDDNDSPTPAPRDDDTSAAVLTVGHWVVVMIMGVLWFGLGPII